MGYMISYVWLAMKYNKLSYYLSYLMFNITLYLDAKEAKFLSEFYLFSFDYSPNKWATQQTSKQQLWFIFQRENE